MSGIAQDRCGTVEYVKQLRQQNQLRESKEGFERWIDQKRLQRLLRREGRTQATYQIPVVVHVIHNGEAVGSGTNIPDAQILSQLSVLNKDYNRLNADAGNTPSEFLPLAGAFDVEFVMAKQDPEGLATTGIVRTRGTKSSWTMNDNYQLKALSYWPSEDYLNIWVCKLTDFLGYSQFPVSALPGLENSSTNRLTDGVVIAYNAFGSSDDGNFILQNVYNKGRTATHEVGHFFGLNHIWGDDDNACTGTDYVDDTPNQAGSTGGCPTHPRVTCDVTSMFQNYLDYTNDACMNLFTQGQVARMDIVIANSPRRASLTSSHGLNNPSPIANDLGVKEIIRPATGECTGAFGPQFEVRNYGSNVVSSARLRIRKDGAIAETRDFNFSPALENLQSANITFSNVSFTSGTHNISIEILLTNGVADGQSSNNNASRTFDVPNSISLPFFETFNTMPANWDITNPDQDLTWALFNTSTPNGNAARMNFYDYEDHVGELDAIVSPSFDLSSAPAALLKFDVAYAQYGSSTDALQVLLLTNCNTTLEDGVVIYNKSGSALSTASATSSSYSPASSGEWRTEIVDLSQYIGQSNLQLAFVGINDWGNNLYVDNIGLTTSPIADVVASQILQPSPVVCTSQVAPVVRIFNAGTLVNKLTITAVVNGTSYAQTFDNLDIPGNTSADIALNFVTLTAGANQIKITLSSPNGVPDFFPGNNEVEMTAVFDEATEELPTRQRFESSSFGNWVAVNPNGDMSWEIVTVNNDPAIVANAFVSTEGDQAWLVSPLLDFTDINDGLLRYDHSYASRSGASDMLYILASRDCGLTFTDTLFRAGSGTLAKGRTSETSWKPSSDSDWTRNNNVSLSDLAGVTSARIAFVFRSGQGNNLYIDNIEFFLSNNPVLITGGMEIYPTVPVNEPLNVTFDLPDKDEVRIDIIDNMGRVMITYQLENVLNQTYTFDLTQRAGLYYVRATTGSSKVYIDRFIIR
ncbi:choice-of-anchor J domain-containing protein [Chryseolinea sp. T2]|uniref:T9SS-dependent choice-of-anchor J family protein n=1 Tax=Chryseolinea sp. T2 TaxID=3129255 RepID=UPI003076F6B9